MPRVSQSMVEYTRVSQSCLDDTSHPEGQSDFPDAEKSDLASKHHGKSGGEAGGVCICAGIFMVGFE